MYPCVWSTPPLSNSLFISLIELILILSRAGAVSPSPARSFPNFSLSKPFPGLVGPSKLISERKTTWPALGCTGLSAPSARDPAHLVAGGFSSSGFACGKDTRPTSDFEILKSHQIPPAYFRHLQKMVAIAILVSFITSVAACVLRLHPKRSDLPKTAITNSDVFDGFNHRD